MNNTTSPAAARQHLEEVTRKLRAAKQALFDAGIAYGELRTEIVTAQALLMRAYETTAITADDLRWANECVKEDQ